MEPQSDDTPLIVIVGETASGKSALALQLAEQFQGEIICADSRTVYRGMDIGTAKPTSQERAIVPHRLLDVVNPDQRFTVADFKYLAERAIGDIHARGHLPLLVGGTGLYVDAVSHDFTFAGEPDLASREVLQTLSVPELQSRLRGLGIPLPTNQQNPRHLIRALETGGVTPKAERLRPNTLLIGLCIDRDLLHEHIIRRVDAMVEQGFVAEVRHLSEQYGWSVPALQAPGYKAFRDYIEGSITLEQAKAQFVQNDLRLAKRQRTWFKRNPDIHWISKSSEAVELVTTFLNK